MLREARTKRDVRECLNGALDVWMSVPDEMSGWTKDGRFGSKVGQIGPKLDKSGAFSDQISVHLAPLHQMH